MVWLNKLLDEDLDDDGKKLIYEVWSKLYDDGVVVRSRSARRVGILREVVEYAVGRLGAYQVDWDILMVELVDDLIYRKCVDYGKVQESGVWENGGSGDEDGTGIEG